MLLAHVGGTPGGMRISDPCEHPETLFRANPYRATGLFDFPGFLDFFDPHPSGDFAACTEARPIQGGGPRRATRSRVRSRHRSGPAPAGDVAAPAYQSLHPQAGSPLLRVSPPIGGPKTACGHDPCIGRPARIAQPADLGGMSAGVLICWRLPLP